MSGWHGTSRGDAMNTPYIITDEQWAETLRYLDDYRAFIQSLPTCEDEPEDDSEATQRIDATEDDWLWMR